MLPEREEYGRPKAKKEEPGSPWSFKIARIAGIPVRLHFTFVLLILWLFAETYSRGMWQVALLVLAVFLCVVLHEYGHALTAKRFGIATRDITLYPIGGVASITGRPKPAAEFWIALAGPLVNVVIAIIFFGLSYVLQGRAPLLSLTLDNMSLIDGIYSANVILPVFNLVPAFPMDGGRVLRAFLAMNMDENRATQIAGMLGQLIAIGVAVAALLWWHNVILMLIALFVFIGAGQEMAMSTNLSVMTGKLVYDAMQVRFRTIESGANLNVAAQMLLDGSQQDFPVVAGDEVVGILTRSGIAKGMGEAGPEAYAIEFAEREIRRVDARESLESAIDAFADGAAPALVYEGEKLVGMLTRENLSEFIMLEHARKQAARRTRQP